MVNQINALIATNAGSNVTGIRQAPSQRIDRQAVQDGTGFEDALKAQLNRDPSVRMSAHAQRRIEARNINFGADEAARLEQAVDKAANKGSRESLILMDDLALVVSIKNRIVITAVDATHRKDDVFTNIDSVVLS